MKQKHYAETEKMLHIRGYLGKLLFRYREGYCLETSDVKRVRESYRSAIIKITNGYAVNSLVKDIMQVEGLTTQISVDQKIVEATILLKY